MATKTCIACMLIKNEEEFLYRKDTNARRPYCKKCSNARKNIWNKINKEKCREYKKRHYVTHRKEILKSAKERNTRYSEKKLQWHLNRNFGITIEYYEILLNKQNYRCAICQLREQIVDKRTGKIRRLHVDHCHTTGIIRGLLCTRCNMAIGFLQNNAEFAEAAAAYIRVHESKIK